MKGQIILGEFGKLCARQSSQDPLEIGELVVSAGEGGRDMLLQVYDLLYGSQVSPQNLELISGLKIEHNATFNIFDESLRMYGLALLKPLLLLKTGASPKVMPPMFSELRAVEKNDMQFLGIPAHPLMLGKLRSGSRVIDVPLLVDGKAMLAHHVLIAATTGRGKSNLVKNMLWEIAGLAGCGALVLDPHDEYFGRTCVGLKDHPAKVWYYTSGKTPAGQRILRINVSVLKPHHFIGVIDWSQPQVEALHAYQKRYGSVWVEHVVRGAPLDDFNEGTLAVVRRRISSLLSLHLANDAVSSDGVFSLNAGETTISDIVSQLEQGKVVIIDTSLFEGKVEILVGSLITAELYKRYKKYKAEGTLEEKPVVTVVLEEAPRVIGKDALERGSNIFSTLAREGRKFQVGLMAITQLPSLIPREVLANMNTKIILGIEMAPERHALIESAAQDLSQDDRAIASLDKGEAIVTSVFTRFAVPIKVGLFGDAIVAQQMKKTVFSGIRTE